MKRTTLYKELIAVAFILVLSFVFISFVDSSFISVKFAQITGSNFEAHFTLFFCFTIGAFGSHFYFLKNLLARENNSIQVYLFLIFSLVFLLSGLFVISWLHEALAFVYEEFNAITFPTDIDKVARNIKLDLLTNAKNMFTSFSATAAVMFLIDIYLLNQLRKRH